MQSPNITFICEGPILGWMRPEGERGHRYDPEVQKAYKRMIGWSFKEAAPRGMPLIEGPISLGVYAHFPYPGTGKDRITLKTSRPDLDNIIKNVKDALNGVAWKDDAQVCQYLDPYKVFDPDAGEHGFLIVTVRMLDGGGPFLSALSRHAGLNGPKGQGGPRPHHPERTQRPVGT